MQAESGTVELRAIHVYEYDPEVLEFWNQPPSFLLRYRTSAGKRSVLVRIPDYTQSPRYQLHHGQSGAERAHIISLLLKNLRRLALTACAHVHGGTCVNEQGSQWPEDGGTRLHNTIIAAVRRASGPFAAPAADGTSFGQFDRAIGPDDYARRCNYFSRAGSQYLLFSKCQLKGFGTNRNVAGTSINFEHALCAPRIGDTRIPDRASPPVPYDLMQAIETAFLERQRYGNTGSTIHVCPERPTRSEVAFSKWF